MNETLLSASRHENITVEMLYNELSRLIDAGKGDFVLKIDDGDYNVWPASVVEIDTLDYSLIIG